MAAKNVVPEEWELSPQTDGRKYSRPAEGPGFTPAPVAPILGAASVVGTNITVPFSGGTFTTLIPQWSSDGGSTWNSLSSDAVSPLSFVGMAAGFYSIRALADGLITSASNVVTATVAASTFTPWKSYNFEFGTNGSSAINSTQGIMDANGAQTPAIDTTRAFEGTRSARCSVNAGQTPMGGVWKFPSATNGGVLAAGQSVWCRARVYIPSTWSINTAGDGGMKFFRWRAYMSGEVPAGSNTIQLRGPSSTIVGLRTENEGSAVSDVTFDPAGGWYDRWVTFETYIKLGRGTSGELRSWVDGILRGECLGRDTLGTDVFQNLWFMFLDYFNNGAPQNQSMNIDKVDFAWSGASVPDQVDAAGNPYMGLV